MKKSFLQKVCSKFKQKYGLSNVGFVVTSREIDFKFCMNSDDNYFKNFVKIVIGECQREDVVQKLQIVCAQASLESDIMINSEMISIARKRYFGI